MLVGRVAKVGFTSISMSTHDVFRSYDESNLKFKNMIVTRWEQLLGLFLG